MNCSCRRALERGLVNQGIYQQGYQAGRESLKELLSEVRFSEIDHDHVRLGHLTVQIPRWLWEAIRKELEQ